MDEFALCILWMMTGLWEFVFVFFFPLKPSQKLWEQISLTQCQRPKRKLQLQRRSSIQICTQNNYLLLSTWGKQTPFPSSLCQLCCDKPPIRVSLQYHYFWPSQSWIKGGTHESLLHHQTSENQVLQKSKLIGERSLRQIHSLAQYNHVKSLDKTS